MNHRSRIAFSTPSTPTFIFGQQSTRLGIYFNDFNVTALILWRRFFGHHFICFFLCYRSFCTVACFGFKMFYNFKKLPSWRLPATLQFNITLCKIFFLSLLFISMFIRVNYYISYIAAGSSITFLWYHKLFILIDFSWSMPPVVSWKNFSLLDSSSSLSPCFF